MSAAQRISPPSVTGGAAPPDYEAWREARWLDIAGPTGKARIVGNGRILDRDTHTFPGIPGLWSTTEAGTLTVTAVAEDEVIVNGQPVIGTVEVPTGRTVEFSGGRFGVIGGSSGAHSFVFYDPAAFASSGISRIDCYPYDSAWVVQGKLRAAPTGRCIEVERLSNPRSTEVIPTPFDLAITLDDGEHVLTVLEDSPGRRLVIFTDETSGSQTPDIGRWLTLPVTEPGRTLPLDFNQVTLSYHHVNPSLFHCPLPPPGNHLPVRIEAGEHTLVVEQGAQA